MRRTAMAVAAWLAVSAAQAGPIFAPPGGVNFGYSGRRIGVSINFGGYYSPYYGPYLGPPPLYSGIVIVQPAPSVVPVRVVQPAVAAPVAEAAPNLVRDEDFPDKIIIRPRNQQLVKREEPPEEPLRPLPGQPAGQFRPIPAQERARVQPDRPLEPLIPDQPEKDPLAESKRQVALGRQAFAAKEFARAERRFQQAAKLAPKSALPYFCLVQARFALGKYREATAAIHDGLRAFPDWPTLPLKVRDLYLDNPQEFEQQRKRLEDALAAHQDDPALLFLYAYQLWFDDRQAEARPLLRRTARLVTAPFFIDLFLLNDGMPQVGAE